MTSYNITEIWEKFLEQFKNSASDTIYNTLIKPIVPLSLENNVITVGVNNHFMKKWLEDTYLTIIENKLSEICNTDIKFKIENLDVNITQTPDAVPPIPEPPKRTPVESENTSVIQTTLFPEPHDSNLNLKYNFDNFVVGNSNRFAYSAAKAVADEPGAKYNPLFIYGGVGLGKTHLMHAIGNKIKENNPNARILYITSEKFLNEIVTSIEKRTMENLKNKYRKIDCLIIDDIQFLEKRERTLEEFFHTFNALHEANKQIIISSDRLPKHIKNIEDRLRSRFEWGLMADIQSPDLETRIAILRKKAELDIIDIPHDVVTLIASNVTTNIREIEGAYTKLVAYSNLMGTPITLDMAKNILHEMGSTLKNDKVSYEDINNVVADYFKIKPDELFTKKRTQNIANARHIAMFLCRDLIDLSYPRIGEIYGGRDHSTVIHAYEKVSAQLKKDASLEKTINLFKEQLSK